MLAAVMRVLFTILVFALAGLLWATVSAARHIRRARRHRKNSGRGITPQADHPWVAAPPPSSLQPSPENPGNRMLRPKPLQSYF